MANRSEKSNSKRPSKTLLPTAVPKAGKASRGRTDATTTPLLLRSGGLALDDQTREFARASAAAKLGKFAKHITRITLHLEDVSGPVGAPVFACRVVIDAVRTELLVVETESPTVRAAIERTLERSERTLRRALERTETRRTRR